MNKFYLRTEIRYTTPDDEEGEYQGNSFTKIIDSDLFDNEKECIEFGNKIIEANLWVEQYVGLVGQRLDRKYGRPLVLLSLKNRAQIFITVEKLTILDSDQISLELQKFNISRLLKEIK